MGELEDLARVIANAGPFYAGIDDDFCAVCHGHRFDTPEIDHKPDCAYVALCRLLNVSPDEVGF